MFLIVLSEYNSNLKKRHVWNEFLFSFLLWLGVNFILRKLAQAASLYVTMVISMEDGQLRIQNKGPKNTDHKAPLGTEIFITDLMHNPMKV